MTQRFLCFLLLSVKLWSNVIKEGDKMKKNQKYFCVAIGLFVIFVLWTLAVCFVDVAAIGPNGSSVGFATLNGYVHNLMGVNMALYTVTDWLGLVPIFFCLAFAIFGVAQWIKRKSIFKVDRDIILLGAFYVFVMVVYVFFETVVINYRPILINEYLEASYPSSTTVLVMSVIPTAVMQLEKRMKNIILKRCITFALLAFVVFMVVVRLISGVHWFTDIVGGALISTSLVAMYGAFTS